MFFLNVFFKIPVVIQKTELKLALAMPIGAPIIVAKKAIEIPSK